MSSEGARKLAVWFVKHYGLESEWPDDDGTCDLCVNEIDAAVAPLVEVADAADYLIDGLRKVNRSEVVTNLDERFERYRIATKALEQWRTGR